MTRRVIATSAVVGVVAVLLAGCGGSGKDSAANATMAREANLYQIDQLEVKFHKAVATHNLGLMMSLFAPGAVFNVDQLALTGKAQIRHWFATQNAAFEPQNHWIADSPTYKIRITMNGDKGTLYFQCHYIDPKSEKVMAVVGVDHNVQEIGGKWLIVDSVAGPAKLGS
ncbi:MAG TPA: nuclear transport factor 2 family protein [Gaiellaceae bacterium]|nr:nuclear transport factor 2 family protein [Gaiellaceae bacterium]